MDNDDYQWHCARYTNPASNVKAHFSDLLILGNILILRVGDIVQLLTLGRVAQRIHRTNADADAAADTTRRGVIQRFLFEGVLHHIDAHLAVAATLITGDALVVGDDMKPR